MKTSTYRIEVRAQGYVTTTKVVSANSIAEAKKQEQVAVMEWCDENAVGWDCANLAFTTIEKQTMDMRECAGWIDERFAVGGNK